MRFALPEIRDLQLDTGELAHESREKYRSFLLANRLTWLAIGLVLLSNGLDWVFDSFGTARVIASLIGSGFCALYVGTWVMRRLGHVLVANVSFLSLVLLHVSTVCWIFGGLSMPMLLFLLTFVLPPVIFPHGRWRWIGWFMGLSLCLFIFWMVWLVLLEQPPLRLSLEGPQDPFMGRVFLMANTTLVFIGLGGLMYYLLQVSHDIEDRLEMERARSEELLLNVLPKSIAERLKQEKGLIADHFEEATVLFADIVGFTPFSAKVSPQDLVSLLDDLFSDFDEIMVTHGLEKIKTIGDAYMAVAGVPRARSDHAQATAEAAIAMVQAVHQWARRHDIVLNARIGLNSGPVVAGVIGRRKFIYDLWGDTVNIASRMESHGVPGAITVSEATYLLLQDRYDWQAREPIHVKGKGLMRTYVLHGEGLS